MTAAVVALWTPLLYAQAVAPLRAAADALDKGRYGEAIAQAKLAREPRLADYSAWIAASAQFQLNRDAEVVEALKAVWSQSPRSPLRGRAAILAAKTYIRSGSPKNAITTLKSFAEELSQPEGDLVLAQALEEAGDLAGAAAAYQRIYYSYPTAAEANDAGAALGRLRESMGAGFPPVSGGAMLGRALKLREARNFRLARQELQALVPMLGGPERELAEVAIGASSYDLRENAPALAYLSSLNLSTPEAGAQRLHYMMQCARRLKNDDQVARLLQEMAQAYPQSKWRMESLIAAANQYVVQNQPALYDPLFRACAASFSGAIQAAQCHWRVAFLEYMRRSGNAGDLLREHLKVYPNSDKAAAALYFLGRLAEKAGDAGSARAYYDEVNAFYPNYYHAVLARDRLRERSIGGAQAAGAVNTWLRTIAFPPRVRKADFTPNALSRRRIERGRLLAGAGLDDFADLELRTAAKTEDQPQVMAMALADLASKRQFPERAIRYIKRYAPGYLYQPIDTAPAEFWKLAFPLAYREPLERYTKLENIDPYLMAALVRQESEFDARVVSRARAYGLAQVLPSTGRELSRKLGIRKFSAPMLFRPELNLQLGTRYFRMLLDSFEGRIEPALASYNAGKNRAVAWLTWYDYKEPAEFVEMIPFLETREYVQIVIRNADVYRRLYGGNVR